MSASVTNIARRRSYRGEEEWFSLLEEVGFPALRSGFIEAGVSPTIAGNLVWFLHEQDTLDRSLSEPSRLKYRKILATLDRSAVEAAARRASPGWRNSPRSGRLSA